MNKNSQFTQKNLPVKIVQLKFAHFCKTFWSNFKSPKKFFKIFFQKKGTCFLEFLNIIKNQFGPHF